MRLRSLRAWAGLRLERLSSSAMTSSGLLDLHEVADLPEHTGELRALRVLRAAPDLAQPERPQRAAVALALADLRPDLGDPKLRQRSPPPPPRAPRPEPCTEAPG